MAAARGSGRTRRAPIFAKGARIGNYEIRELLGEGGMGQVFEAFDHDLWRMVAVKAAWPKSREGELRSEARALAAVRHPSLLVVHGFGRHDQTDYVVVERVLGHSLWQYLRDRRKRGGPMSTDEALDVLIPLTSALSAVHAAGLVHRDVKSPNVMIAHDGRIVLMDFGLVRSTSITPTDEDAGTPEYIAPEAISKEVEVRNAFRLDLYALGIIGHEVLTGRPPFRGRTTPDVLAQHLAAEVPGVDRDDVPLELQTILTELLAKDPDERPSSADAVVHRLQRIRARDAISSFDADLRVLIVEDEPATAKLMKFLVKRTLPRAQIEILDDGDKAVERLRIDPPHVVILDLSLPGTSGVELCMYARGSHLRCEIIVASASVRPQEVQLLHEIGVDQIITKGPQLEARLTPLLVAALQRHVARRFGRA